MACVYTFHTNKSIFQLFSILQKKKISSLEFVVADMHMLIRQHFDMYWNIEADKGLTHAIA